MRWHLPVTSISTLNNAGPPPLLYNYVPAPRTLAPYSSSDEPAVEQLKRPRPPPPHYQRHRSSTASGPPLHHPHRLQVTASPATFLARSSQPSPSIAAILTWSRSCPARLSGDSPIHTLLPPPNTSLFPVLGNVLRFTYVCFTKHLQILSIDILTCFILNDNRKSITLLSFILV